MDKIGNIIEFIIKSVFAFFSVIAIVFVVKNCAYMMGFFSVSEENDIMFYRTMQITHVGKIYNGIGVVNEINLRVISKGFIAFIINIDWICYVYIVLVLLLLIILFTFPKWTMVSSYLKLSGYTFILYILKYILVLFVLAITFDGTNSSVYLSMKISTVIYLIFSFLEMMIFSLWICKFVLNLKQDIKTLHKCC